MSTFEDALGFSALHRAAHIAARGKRKNSRVAQFMMDLEPELLALERELMAGEYHPRAFRTFTIKFPKFRTISAADFRDRVVHHAVCAALNPMFERFAIFDSYACHPGKGGLRALKRAQHFARRFRFVLRLDIFHFFETVDHDVLLTRLQPRVGEPRLMQLIERFVCAGAPGSPLGKGLPIGNLTSQHFGNFLLGFVDHFAKERLRTRGYVRYMDDFALFADTKAELWHRRDAISAFLQDKLQLGLRPEFTTLTPVSEGFAFLGFRIWPNLVRFDPRRVRRFRAEIRRLHRGLHTGGLDEDSAARSMQGLVGWASHANSYELRRSLITRLEESKI